MVRVSVIAALLAVSCKAKESAAPPPPTPKAEVAPTMPTPGALVSPGTLKRATIETDYGIAVPPGSNLAELEKLARKRSANVTMTRASISEIFTGEQLAFLTEELAPADASGVKGSQTVILLRGTGTAGMKVARELATVTRDVADAAHGWVIDPETFQILPATAFHDHVPTDHPDARKLIAVHTVLDENEQPYLDTAGMHRYGLPELYFAGAPTSDIEQVAHFINGAAQSLLDGGDVNAHGELVVDFHKLDWDIDVIVKGTGKAVLTARWAKQHDAGEDDELVVELVPPAGAGPEGTVKLIDDCFGYKPDKVTMLNDDDPELMAAVAKAKADLVKLQPHFAKGIPMGEQLTVKARFTDDKGTVEWMWVDVVAFKGNMFAGTLDNLPGLIKSLRDGQKVKVKLADIGDYLHETKDGKTAGGYSIELMRKRGLVEE